MRKLLKVNVTAVAILVLATFVALANCVPTSVLVNTKDSSKLNNSKVKRSSGSNPQSSSSATSNRKTDIDSHLHGGKSEISLGNSQTSSISGESKPAPQKRGVNSQLMYGDIFNEVPSGPVPNGIWADEVDPSVVYPDLQDFEDYQRNSYRPKPYDNLQSILNAEMYPEPVALPLQYPYRYYGDRKKRSNKKNKFDLRLKRESKLTPADMLALVALVEAGERSRQEAENEEAINEYQKSLLSPYGSQADDTNDWLNSWQDQAYDYNGLPYNLHSVPRYDILEDPRLASNYYPSKRYMVAKKKRSLGHFLSEPSVVIPSSSIAYDTRYLSPELVGKGSKKYQKYF